MNGDRAWAELPLGIEFRISVGGIEADLVSYCRSQYRAQRAEGTWRISRITSIYERDQITAAVPGTTLQLDPAAFAALRPSYRCLAWYLRETGDDVRPDLLCDDDPDAVARHYQAERAWLDNTTATPADTLQKEH